MMRSAKTLGAGGDAMTLHSPLPPWPTLLFVAEVFFFYVTALVAGAVGTVLGLALATLAACS